jgi:hypothetical protein
MHGMLSFVTKKYMILGSRENYLFAVMVIWRYGVIPAQNIACLLSG